MRKKTKTSPEGMKAERFTQYLRGALPPDSALFGDVLARLQLERDDHLNGARELRFFEPFKLVTVQYWHPLAGSPGIVLEDVRTLWDVRDDSFRPSSLEWINAFRQDHPLDLRILTEDDAIAYVQEIVHMIPRADRWGFHVESIPHDRRPRYMYISYRELKSQISDALRTQLVRFDPHGGIEEFWIIQREIPKG